MSAVAHLLCGASALLIFNFILAAWLLRGYLGRRSGLLGTPPETSEEQKERETND